MALVIRLLWLWLHSSMAIRLTFAMAMAMNFMLRTPLRAAWHGRGHTPTLAMILIE